MNKKLLFLLCATGCVCIKPNDEQKTHIITTCTASGECPPGVTCSAKRPASPRPTSTFTYGCDHLEIVPDGGEMPLSAEDVRVFCAAVHKAVTTVLSTPRPTEDDPTTF